ncbi:MAG: hypothetical protein E7447_05890 [Ruminococcaceae bacterium]|nr:hypothetical protein [Oscillospiraceae bacterium]
MQQKEILIKSSLDGSMQPSLFYKAASSEKRPLLVGLHTWSWDRFNQVENMLPLAEQWVFNLLLPEFRGANLKENPHCTDACGSDLAKQDIKDAIDFLIENENVDPENIFLLGASGGGHMALLMAGMCPDLFKAVGAFVPITDLEKWEAQSEFYGPDIRACCSGQAEEMRKRSPMTYLDNIAKANLKIFHGKRDSVVPVSHSVQLFNAIMEKYPDATVYLDIFDGAHEMDMQSAAYWLMSQYNREKKNSVTG